MLPSTTSKPAILPTETLRTMSTTRTTASIGIGYVICPSNVTACKNGGLCLIYKFRTMICSTIQNLVFFKV